MGRYYNGDINGKFWFALQSSDAADRFGVTGIEPSYLQYYFSEEDLESVYNEIKSIEEDLGDKLELITKFFEENNGYNDDMLAKAGISKDELREYADLELGKKIRDCIKDQGYCKFEAEI